MGRVFERYIDAPRVHVCAKCTAHLANDDEIISRSFQGDLGRAFLFEKAVNSTFTRLLSQRNPPSPVEVFFRSCESLLKHIADTTFRSMFRLCVTCLATPSRHARLYHGSHAGTNARPGPDDRNA